MSKSIYVKVGTTRIVILIPLLCLVVKIPIIRFFMLFKDLMYSIISPYPKKWKYFWIPPTACPFGLRCYIIAGIVANWSEYRFYRKTKNPFLWPTYFSFFGIFNIQKIGKKSDYSSNKIWDILYTIAGNDLVADNHCFANRNNFCVDENNKLRLIDYASKGAQKVILQYGEQFSTIDGSPSR